MTDTTEVGSTAEEPAGTATGGDEVSHLRASMELRRQAEEELSQAAEARRAALDRADQTIAHAEAAAAEVRHEAERVAGIATAEAHRRAEELVAAARAEATRITDQAEATAKALILHGRDVLDRLEEIAQALRSRMDEVGTGVGELLTSIHDVRGETGGPVSDTQPS